MSRPSRVRAAFVGAWRSFVRRRTAVFFTFFFPVILIVIFGALVQTGPAGGGLFSEPPGYYVPGYVAVVVLFTPLSRLGSELARHREDNRFEKLATTPLTRGEWLLAETLVNVVLVGAAVLVVLALSLVVAGDTVRLSPWLAVVVPAGTVLFCGVGALIGRLADSQDGAITAANAIGLPLLFLSDTFVPPSMLPDWFAPLLALSPLTYVARATRAMVYVPPGGPADLGRAPVPGLGDLVVVLVLAAAAFAVGARAIPRTD